MVWRSGRVAGTVRKVAIVCFYGLLRRGYADRKALFQVGICFSCLCTIIMCKAKSVFAQSLGLRQWQFGMTTHPRGRSSPSLLLLLLLLISSFMFFPGGTRATASAENGFGRL
jgi:hypothetical protein